MNGETKDPTAQQLELLAREERQKQGPGHPPVRRLIAYHTGELAEHEAEMVADHLAVCRECVQTLRELPLFFESLEAGELSPGVGMVPAPAETEASWLALRQRLAPDLARAAAPREPVVAAPSRFHRLGGWPLSALAFAAVLAVAAVGALLWLAMQRGTEPRQLVAVSVPGRAEVMRGGEPGRLPAIRFESDAALLALPLPGRQRFPTYRVEIRSPGGPLRLEATVAPAVVAAPPAAPRADGQPPRLLTVVIASGQLAPGDYRVRILGLRDGRGEALSEYPLRVLAPE